MEILHGRWHDAPARQRDAVVLPLSELIGKRG
jgi:hypothetical protein